MDHSDIPAADPACVAQSGAQVKLHYDDNDYDDGGLLMARAQRQRIVAGMCGLRVWMINFWKLVACLKQLFQNKKILKN